MISIERISIDFVMDEEKFAQELYANWDSFCQICLEKILDNCLTGYNRNGIMLEISKLNLDLGTIKEEEFYLEFPRRLYGELIKALPYLHPEQNDKNEDKKKGSRLANILYYLEYGIQHREWANIDFNLSEELEAIVITDKNRTEKIAILCITNEHILKRILLQASGYVFLINLYSFVMERMVFAKDKKRRFMEIFLEIQSDIPMKFIYETQEEGKLHVMSELIETGSVRRIIEKETAEHAEVDRPPYWH